MAAPLLILLTATAAPQLAGAASTTEIPHIFRAGAYAMDVTPTNFPVIVNGGFFALLADRAHDPLHARCLVLDDGATRVGLCVLDSCVIPREFADAAKQDIAQATGIPVERLMISATHTHFAPSLMAAHGADEDPAYPAFLRPRLVEGFRRAISNLAVARVGWAVAAAPEWTHTRVWIRRPDRIGTDPFGDRIVRANMHPGHQNPDAIAPSGPSDPDLSLLAVQTPEGRPIAVLANYSMHYHGGTQAVSADYYGRFADRLGGFLGVPKQGPAFVGIMSQGTSGDQQWMDYGKAAQNTSIDAYAEALARLASAAYQKIQWHDWVPLVMRDQDLPLRTRQPSAARLAWAKGVVEAFQGRAPKTLPEIFAREQLWLHDHPVRPVKLQALRVGELGLVTASAEVFAISGLKVKAQSPLRPTFFIELANGEDGYIPPPEHHALGSYNTWACRTAGLEVDAENKIVEGLLSLLEEVSGQPRRPIVDAVGSYARAVLASRPVAYWRLNELDGRRLPAAAGHGRAAASEPGVVFHLDGPDSAAFAGSNVVNRAYHFAGGRLKTGAAGLGPAYSVELWFWNGLPQTLRAITGHLFSRGAENVFGAPGEHLSIGGTRTAPGRLVFANGGSDVSLTLVGRTELALKTWHHVVLVRDGRNATVYLNGDPTPELSGEIEPGQRSEADQVFLGGRSDNMANFEGKLDEIALYDRALRSDEAAAHFRATGLTAPPPPNAGPRGVVVTGDTARAWQSLQPLAHWLAPVTAGSTALSSAGGPSATAEGDVGLPASQHATAQFSGGRMRANLPGLGANYTVAFWFYSDLPDTARPVTAYLFSRGEDGAEGAPGDHLGIGGTHSHAGRLFLFNGNQANDLLAGPTVLPPQTWHHVVFVREGRKARVYLDGLREPEISGEIAPGHAAGIDQIFLGGRSDNFANLQGRLTDIAVFPRVLRADEFPAQKPPLPQPADVPVPGQGAGSGTVVPGPHDPRPAATPPLSPAESLGKIHLREGYQAELVAAEPLVESPVAIDWDERGRLWVVEMVDYPLGLDGKGKPGGRIRVLEDTDGDGRYDHSTLFAENLSFPTGILTWRDGVIITAAPEIVFLKDTDGDGKADVRRVLFSGFFEGNQQLRVNGLRWGLDNWVHCASGAAWRGYGTGAKIKSHVNGQEYDIGSRDFRFHPDTGELDPESGPSQFGRNPDDWGHWFGVQNSWPLWHYVLADPYLRRNPHVPATDPVQQVVTPKNPPVFPASTREKRFHSFSESGHFTSACAAMILRDPLLFGTDDTRHAFTCEPFHNLVQHNRILDDGVSFHARRAEEESTTDFFASEDRWCRPVMTRTGPDGALWIVDMYRYMIEHPEWLPAEGKSELLPHYRLGEDRGRIYRVFSRERPPRSPAPLGRLTLNSLVEALDSPNGWQRDKAQMLLLWKADAAAVPRLQELALASRNPLARLHALCTLDGLGALTADIVVRALVDPHPGVRCQALRLAETRATPAVLAAAARLVDDPDPKVRLQLACTLGEWQDASAGAALGRLAVAHHADKFVRAAVMSSALPHSLALVDATLAAGGPALATLADPLIQLTLGANRRDSLARLLQPMLTLDADRPPAAVRMESFAAFLDTLARRKTDWRTLQAAAPEDALGQQLDRANGLLVAAKTLASDARQPGLERLAAAALLARDTVHRRDAVMLLAAMLSARTPAEQQRAALVALGISGDETVPDVLLRAWPELGPETRGAAFDELLNRESWAWALAQATEKGQIRPSAFDAARRDRLLKHASVRVKTSAAKAFQAGGSTSRAAVVDLFRPALALAGDQTRGAAVFGKLCSSCHRLGDIGTDLGPNLQSVANHPAEKLLVSILDPNAAIEPGYTAYTVELAGGEEFYGLITAETGNSLSLRLPDGKSRTLLRSEIVSLRSANQSLMPEGLETSLSPTDLADLISHLKAPSRSTP